MSAPTLTDFLLARIAEDEEDHRPLYGAESDQPTCYEDGKPYPCRVLAECDAKRQIVERYLDVKAYVDRGNYDDEYAAELSGLETALEFLTAPYDDHPDWREEWRP